MNFNRHLNLEGKHAVLSPSKPSWLGKNEDELIQMYQNTYAQIVGTTLHEFAKKRIEWRMSLRKSDSDDAIFYLLDHGLPYYSFEIERVYNNLRTYVNDSIGYRMTPEVVIAPEQLVNCFGTADSISYKNGLLRINDLKTGIAKPNMDQLLAYAALFFLEYRDCKVEQSEIELRIYHGDEIIFDKPDPEEVKDVMEKILSADRTIEKFKLGE